MDDFEKPVVLIVDDVPVNIQVLAEALVERDPQLATPRGQAVRVLLHIFEQREAFRTLRAG